MEFFFFQVFSSYNLNFLEVLEFIFQKNQKHFFFTNNYDQHTYLTSHQYTHTNEIASWITNSHFRFFFRPRGPVEGKSKNELKEINEWKYYRLFLTSHELISHFRIFFFRDFEIFFLLLIFHFLFLLLKQLNIGIFIVLYLSKSIKQNQPNAKIYFFYFITYVCLCMCVSLIFFV